MNPKTFKSSLLVILAHINWSANPTLICPIFRNSSLDKFGTISTTHLPLGAGGGGIPHQVVSSTPPPREAQNHLKKICLTTHLMLYEQRNQLLLLTRVHFLKFETIDFRAHEKIPKMLQLNIMVKYVNRRMGSKAPLQR